MQISLLQLTKKLATVKVAPVVPTAVDQTVIYSVSYNGTDTAAVSFPVAKIVDPQIAIVATAETAVTSLQTAATKDLTVEENLTVAEALVQPAKDSVAKVDDISEKASLVARVAAAEKTVTDARTVFDARDYTYTVTDGKAQITGYTGVEGDVTIPSTLAGSPVTSIGDSAFSNTSLTSINIPQAVTSIGDEAFNNCAALTSIIVSVDNFKLRQYRRRAF